MNKPIYAFSFIELSLIDSCGGLDEKTGIDLNATDNKSTPVHFKY